jgi:hypothetical protein
MEFGMSVARAALVEVGARVGQKVSIFCQMVDDLLSSDNLRDHLEFYIASFSRERDSLPQWQAYAADAQGFALGLAPHLFAVEHKPDRKPHENVYVVPVCYGPAAGRLHHLPAIESAARIVAETVERKWKAMRTINRGMPFFDEMAKNLIAAELILNC